MKTASISRSRFVQVPAEFLDTLAKDKEIAWVWMVLWDKAGASKEAWISVAGLTERCKMNVHTIKADRKSTRLNSSHVSESRMPSSA